jgi:hypothetical protein
MSAFDLPPSTPPVSFDPPNGNRSRKRMAVVAAASIGLATAGVVVVAQLAADGNSAPVAHAAAPTETITTTPPAPEPTTVPSADERDEPESDSDPDGEIVIRIGDEEPIVIDLGELGDLGDLGELGDLDLPEWRDWGSLPPLLDLGQLGDLGELDFDKLEQCIGGGWSEFQPGSGGDLTIAGDDGVSVVEWGEGDGSVTITRDNGEVTVSSQGDVEVEDLPDSGEAPPLPDFRDMIDCLESGAGVSDPGR